MNDITEEQLWRERQAVVEPKEDTDPFVPAQLAEPTPDTEVLVKVEL